MYLLHDSMLHRTIPASYQVTKLFYVFSFSLTLLKLQKLEAFTNLSLYFITYFLFPEASPSAKIGLPM